jgi:hypothetical protein
MARLRDSKGWQGVLVCLLIANLLVAVTLTVSPKLHELLHRDADRSEHQCVVTVMVSGGSDDSPVFQVFDVAALFASAPDFLPEIHSRHVAPLFLTAHVFEHAPPLA